MKKVLKAFLLQPTGIFIFAWILLGSAIAAKSYGNIAQSNLLFTLYFLFFTANGIVNLLIERWTGKGSQ